jgi:hypothetical protein
MTGKLSIRRQRKLCSGLMHFRFTLRRAFVCNSEALANTSARRIGSIMGSKNPENKEDHSKRKAQEKQIFSDFADFHVRCDCWRRRLAVL